MASDAESLVEPTAASLAGPIVEALEGAERSRRRGDVAASIEYCRQALDISRRNAVPQPHPHLRAIHLLLAVSEPTWRGPFAYGNVRVETLVAEAQAIAAETGDPALCSLAHIMSGRHLIATGNRPDGVAAFAAALRAASAAGNNGLAIDAMIDLGHYTAGGDLPKARRILAEARARLERSRAEYPPDQARLRAGRLAEVIGVAEFDIGNFDVAERWLRSSVADLTRSGPPDHATLASNYLAQLLAATGRFTEAAKTLLNTLEPATDDRAPHTLRGYNLSLLGLVRLESGRTADAYSSIVRGYEHLKHTRHLSMLPLTRNAYAELLMRPGTHRDLDRAYRLLGVSVRECRRTGYQRSEIAALAQQAKIDLARRRITRALRLSAAAAGRLDQVGCLPALRGEEVYLIRHQVLRASGEHVLADRALAQGLRILLGKAASLADPANRATFLRRVPVSVALLAAARRYLPADALSRATSARQREP